ncbi:MAG: DUF47 family protein [Proteobacteria bacterium]|jgi:uncharacterized protein|nr:DUF47 family protein [Pseudomonadota bacterium]
MALSDLLFGRQKEIQKRLAEYMDHWWECVDCLRLGMEAYLEEGPGEKVDYYHHRIDKEESKGDELRRAIERSMFEKALMPESRGDVLRVLDALDLVINRTESVIRQLVIERLEVEPWVKPGLGKLVDATVETCKLLHAAANRLLEGDDVTVPGFVEKVDRAESRCDHLEQDLLGRIFASDLDLARKLQLKDFVRRMGTVADFCESASDHVQMASIKRRV